MANINKKTILYLITQSELGGAQKYVYELAKGLKSEFNIIVAFGEQGSAGELAKKLKQENIDYFIIPHLIRSISPINDCLALFEIIKIIKKIKPDIIHLNSSKISILGSIASQFVKIQNPKSKIQNLYTVHGWVFNEPLPKWQKLFYKYAEKITARWKDKLICVSEFDRQLAIQEKIAPSEKLITIHNGIEKINFLPKKEAEIVIASKLPITNYKLLIASIGNLYKTKGYEYLIKAISILITNYKLPITSVIIGEGEERKKLEDLIEQLDLTNNIFLIGRLENASAYLKAFDLYVCSSVKEGLSYTMIEAMQAGLPIVATQVGGNPELIEDGIEGILVETQNQSALAEAINKLVNNDELKIKFGEAARIKALKDFTLSGMISETKRIYQEE